MSGKKRMRMRMLSLTNERTLKAVDSLLEAIAEEAARNRGGVNRVEILYEKALEAVRNHPMHRGVAAMTPHKPPTAPK